MIEPEPISDDRGFFARLMCRDEFARHGIEADYVQCSVSYNRRRGIVRGLHYQADPWAEAKLVRCTAGMAFDAIVDLREDSPTFGRWHAETLSAANRWTMVVPRGFAHGFQALEDDTELFYQISTPYQHDASRGVRWDDPALGIAWPLPGEIQVSERDRSLPCLHERSP